VKNFLPQNVKSKNPQKLFSLFLRAARDAFSPQKNNDLTRCAIDLPHGNVSIKIHVLCDDSVADPSREIYKIAASFSSLLSPSPRRRV
jgi:hypothetical protein